MMLLTSICFLIILLSANFQSTSGATIYVNQSFSSTTCDTISYQCPNIYSAVQIAVSKDLISLAGGTYSGTNNVNICVGYQCKFIDVSLIGEGNTGDVVITGSESTSRYNRGLNITNGAFSLIKNIVFDSFVIDAVRNIISSDNLGFGGAAIYISNSNVTLDNLVLQNNIALLGGAVAISNSDVQIVNSYFLQNQASSYGGGIFGVDSNITVLESVFRLNNVSSTLEDVAGSGGAILFSGTQQYKIIIANSLFQNNTAQRSGGALFLEPSNLQTGSGLVLITFSTFEDNGLKGLSSCISTSSCNSMGGAVYVSSVLSTIEYCNFLRNYAYVTSSNDVGQGGALFTSTAYIYKKISSVIVQNCNFSSNGAQGQGGAIFTSNQKFSITSSNFSNNFVVSSDLSFSTSPSQGGALWISNGGEVGSVASSSFVHNLARSGWAGAIYGTGNSIIQLSDVVFTENAAISSYTTPALGGAIMVTDEVSLSIDTSIFLRNFARPNFTTIPLTYSGAGGAIYAQSVGISINGSFFEGNAAYTGQFDSGSTGGAIVVEDCNPMTISRSSFIINYAAGYFGSVSYASAGTGGALYVKFSVASVYDSHFQSNWASAGGSENSLGGAVAIFFDYSSVEHSNAGIMFNNTIFVNNSAFGQLCTVSQAGTAGAIGIVGVASPSVFLNNVTFNNNIAVRPTTNNAVSAGGAIAVSLSTNLSITDATFRNNFAIFGVGNDVASLTATSEDYNYFNFDRTSYYTDEKLLQSQLLEITNSTKNLCVALSELEDSFNDAPNRRRLEEHKILTRKDFQEMRSIVEQGIILTKLRNGVISTEDNSILRARSLLNQRDRLMRERLWQSRGQYPHAHDFYTYSSATHDDESFSFSALNLLPGLAFTAGSATLMDSRFEGKYHIFVGSFAEVNEAQLGDTSITVSQLSSNLQILGKTEGEGVILTILGADCYIDLLNETDSLALREINIFNGTLSVSSDVNVSRSSFLYTAVLKGVPSRYLGSTNFIPNINFLQDVLTGYTLYEALNSNQRTIISIIRRHNGTSVTNVTSQSVLQIDSCSIYLTGVMLIDSPYRGTDVFFNNTYSVWNRASNCLVDFSNNASIIVAETGSLILFTSTFFKAQKRNNPAITNQGRIALLGTTYNVINSAVTTTPTNSLDCIMTVFGNFIQNSTGIVDIILNTTYQALPVLNLVNNDFFGGRINVSFSGDPNLVLYDSDPSTFDLVAYLNITSNPHVPPATILAPEGLGFGKELTKVRLSNNLVTYQESIIVEKIACSQIDTSYQSLSTQPSNSLYPCYICLQNSSCAQCQNSMCLEGSLCGAYGGVKYSSSCCTSSCNPPYGSCEGSNGNTEFGCVCSGWFYVGSNCDNLSLEATIIIFVGTFVITTAILGFFVYRRSANQKQQVLEELREGILRHTETAHNDYILNMQQALILNDVFVKFEEIKLEQKIGEGSFGIVHKATFRGAQVAVKQMRSMFFELTDKDIEEFRREAYVMSRLRHPNIVLVMGISLMEQETVPLPKSRTLNGAEDLAEAMGDKKKVNKPPPKTVCIVTEYLEQGSLADILYGPTRLPAEIWTYELILTCALQAARGMLYLHSHQPPICHRDLKSSNLVVDDHWVVKVTDFGMSRIVPEKVQEMDKGLGEEFRESIGRDSLGEPSVHDAVSLGVTNSSSAISSKKSSIFTNNSRQSWNAAPLEMTSNMGTTAWCAPEILTASNRTRYSVKVDVYSFGMVLWELWEKKRPFDDLTSRFDIMDAVRSGKRPEISENCPPAYKALVQRCWHTDPSRRPMFHYIVRYLKDELARVKRQKMAPGSANTTGLNIASAANYLRASFGGSNSGTAVPLNNSNTTKKTAGEDGRSSQSGHSTSTAQSAVSAPIPMVPIGINHIPEEIEEESKVPHGRTPLVKATFGRSLSYLTESPMTENPYLNNYNAQQGFGARNTESNPESAANNRASMGWRDRYVMRFSGWSSTKPDAGLPPSLTAPQNVGPTGGGSPISPPTISALHQQPYKTLETPLLPKASKGTPSQPIPSAPSPAVENISISSVD